VGTLTVGMCTVNAICEVTDPWAKEVHRYRPWQQIRAVETEIDFSMPAKPGLDVERLLHNSCTSIKLTKFSDRQDMMFA